MNTNTKYHVVKFSQNSWNPDGSGIVECDCGHKHRTVATAQRCLDNLMHYNGETWSARWHKSVIRHVDNTQLTEDEKSDLYWYQANR